MFAWLKPAPEIARLPAEQVDPVYRRLRRQVFAGIFLGYAGYYLVRKNFSLAIPDILKAYPQHTKAELGTALTALSVAYGFSKFLMGSVSDRSNPRYFLPLGLALSAAVTLAFGCLPALYLSLSWMICLQGLNGWCNGMGWAPCGKTMVHWFSRGERGRAVSCWNVAHNVGGALVATLAACGVMLLGDWTAKFTFNAGIALVIAVIAYLLLRDTPQSCGLPPIEEHRRDYPAEYGADHERPLGFREIFLTHVLGNRSLWCLAVANAFVYFVRYGVVDWVPTYLQTAKHFDFQQSSVAWSVFEWAGVPGTILCGWVSDRYFRSRRAPATILFMVPTLLGLVVYGLNRQGPLWIDIAALSVIGFFIYGPIMLIGLQALDLAPKKAAGTAAGFTGFFGYVFGSALAGGGVGWIADRAGWGGVIAVLATCCVLTMVFSAFTLRDNPAPSSLP